MSSVGLLDQSRHVARDGWQRVKFGDIATQISERIDDPSQAGVEYYVGLEHLDSESLKIRRWGTPDDVEATKLRFKPGDIIFGKRRAYQRKVAVAEFEGICSAHAMVLRAREEKVVKEFLPFFMQSEEFSQRAVAISEGSLSPTIKWKTLAQQEFALPPKDEQRRIAEILRAADEVLSKAEACVQSVDSFRSVLFKQFLEHHGAGGTGPTDVHLGALMAASPQSGYSASSTGWRKRIAG